jgi:uncharacterized protein involved in response to NO
MSRSLRDTYWLTGGFRPFFFLGALSMALSVLAWIPILSGHLELPTAFIPRDWHIHTMLFGGVSAIIAGFALTAVANWTGRPPVAGGELLVLVLVWLAGRIAVTLSALTGAWAAMAVDLAFPLALVAVFAREVVAGGNLRNLRIVAIVALYGFANAAFHTEAALTGLADHAARAGIAVVLLLVMLIGGRIIPAFTRNWLMQRRALALPAGFSRLDGATMLVSAAALAVWIAVPDHLATALLMLAAGLANGVRLSRWCGLATRSDPLLLILHLGFATVPLGFVLEGLSILLPGVLEPSAAAHVWTAGTFGMMTLAVMTRASRGHSGHPLTAGRLEVAIYALVALGAAARVLAPYAGNLAGNGGGNWVVHLFACAALLWALAYLLFAAGYARMLLWRPGLPVRRP